MPLAIRTTPFGIPPLSTMPAPRYCSRTSGAAAGNPVAAHPIEVAYFDRGPVDGTKRGMGGYWSAYWYNGYIYGSEIARGVDVFKLAPNKFITQNEIDAANQVHFDELNVQNQPKITWPANFVVARAYVDQLARSNALPPKQLASMN